MIYVNIKLLFCKDIWAQS